MPRDDIRSIEAQAVTHLYSTMLGRAPDEGGFTHCIEALQSGATLSDLVRAIETSEEYCTRHAKPSSTHSLAHIKEVYNTEYLSFFTHKGEYRPLTITIETVNICNNDCIICPYSAQTRRKQTMTMPLFEKIIRDYAEIGGGQIGLTPMVGEIFLDKLLLQRLQMLTEHPSIREISAITNASMVNLYGDIELAAILTNFARLNVSIYGLDAEEFTLMTRKASYEQFYEGLCRILAILGPDKVLLCGRQLKARSESEVESWLEQLARDSGINGSRLKFSGTRTFANWGHFDTNIPLPLSAKWLPARVNHAQCALPLISAQILSDGTTSFCGCANFDGISELNIGNIAETSLREMMRSDRVTNLWNWPKCGVPEFCKTCTFHMPIEKLGGWFTAFSDPLGTFGG
jgi:Radical SAM superfamily/Iron-sulfur cluster-binding domain